MSRYEDDWFAPKSGLLSRASMANELGPPPSLQDRDWGVPLPPTAPRDVVSGLPMKGPLPPRRPPEFGSIPLGERSNQWHKDYVERHRSPRPLSPWEQEMQDKLRQQNEVGRERFEELKRDYPYGSGYPENSPSFPNPPEQQFNVKQIDKMIGRPSWGGEENFADQEKATPLPPEFRPKREIPLGELQRRWGVPRLEDL